LLDTGSPLSFEGVFEESLIFKVLERLEVSIDGLDQSLEIVSERRSADLESLEDSFHNLRMLSIISEPLKSHAIKIVNNSSGVVFNLV
jgi:hypothetical protein